MLPSYGGFNGKCLLKGSRSKLPEGYSTVGIHLDVSHLAATPIGMNVIAKATLRGH